MKENQINIVTVSEKFTKSFFKFVEERIPPKNEKPEKFSEFVDKFLGEYSEYLSKENLQHIEE